MYRVLIHKVPDSIQGWLQLREGKHNLRELSMFYKNLVSTKAKYSVTIKGVNIWNNSSDEMKM